MNRAPLHDYKMPFYILKLFCNFVIDALYLSSKSNGGGQTDSLTNIQTLMHTREHVETGVIQ